MPRRARSFLSYTEEKHIPKIVSRVPENIIERKSSKYYYEKSAMNLPELIVGQPVPSENTPITEQQLIETRNYAEHQGPKII